MKEYLDKKIDRCLSKEEGLENLKVSIGESYITLRRICQIEDLFLDECIALAYEKELRETENEK